MIIRDARPADMEVVRRLIGQLADEPDDAEFRRRFERVSSAAGHRVIVAEVAGKVVGVLHVLERPALEKPGEAMRPLPVDGLVR